MAKFDLKSVYRSVSISKESQRFTGLKFVLGSQIIYIRDTILPFGSKLAPGIFHRLTQAVKRMMARRGLLQWWCIWMTCLFVHPPWRNVH